MCIHSVSLIYILGYIIELGACLYLYRDMFLIDSNTTFESDFCGFDPYWRHHQVD